MPYDRELLQDFVRENSQAAFRQLVERHSHWLYSVCLRRLGDSAAAEDATQAVFIALAQRAPSLMNEKTIGPWLHQAARFCAAKILRARSRRQRHESQAAGMNSAHLAPSPASCWQEIEAEVEPALDRLGAKDRATIVLRFYEAKSHPEIAATLGISLEASQKRLSRALQRLRDLLVRNGSGGATLSAIAIGDLLAQHGVGTAPASLVASLSASGSTAATCVTPVAKQILFSMSMATMKGAAIAAVVLLLTIPAGLLLLHSWDATPVLAQASQPAAAVPASSPSLALPVTSPASATSVFEIPNDQFKGRSKPNEHLIDVDPQTRRIADSAPAGRIKSLLPAYLPNDQEPALRFARAPYDQLYGKRVRLSAWLKTRNVEQWCGLEIIVFGPNDQVLLVNDMRGRPVFGTTDWSEQQIVVDVPGDATNIAVLALLYGKGEVWSDGFRLQVVGPEVALTDAEPWQKFSFFGASYTAAGDPSVLHDGHPTICIASTAKATAKQWISYNFTEPHPEKFKGTHIRVTVWMKSSGVSGGSGVWIRGFGASGKPADEVQRGHRPLRGTTDWKQYTGEMDVPEDATTLSWGIVMNGTGKIWLDVESARCVIDDTHGL